MTVQERQNVEEIIVVYEECRTLLTGSLAQALKQHAEGCESLSRRIRHISERLGQNSATRHRG